MQKLLFLLLLSFSFWCCKTSKSNNEKDHSNLVSPNYTTFPDGTGQYINPKSDSDIQFRQNRWDVWKLDSGIRPSRLPFDEYPINWKRNCEDKGAHLACLSCYEYHHNTTGMAKAGMTIIGCCKCKDGKHINGEDEKIKSIQPKDIKDDKIGPYINGETIRMHKAGRPLKPLHIIDSTPGQLRATFQSPIPVSKGDVLYDMLIDSGSHIVGREIYYSCAIMHEHG